MLLQASKRHKRIVGRYPGIAYPCNEAEDDKSQNISLNGAAITTNPFVFVLPFLSLSRHRRPYSSVACTSCISRKISIDNLVVAFFYLQHKTQQFCMKKQNSSMKKLQEHPIDSTHRKLAKQSVQYCKQNHPCVM